MGSMFMILGSNESKSIGGESGGVPSGVQGMTMGGEPGGVPGVQGVTGCISRAPSLTSMESPSASASSMSDHVIPQSHLQLPTWMNHRDCHCYRSDLSSDRCSIDHDRNHDHPSDHPRSYHYQYHSIDHPRNHNVHAMKKCK